MDLRKVPASRPVRYTAVILLVTIPYLVAWWRTPPGYVFSGFIINTYDSATYIAKMRSALWGWTYHNLYTPFADAGGYFFLLYNFTGHIALWLHMSFWWTSTLFRLVLSVLLLWEIEKLLPLTGIPERLRGWAWWFVVLFSPFIVVLSLSEELPFGSMFSTTHFVLLLALQVMAWRYVLQSVRLGNAQAWTAGLAVAAMGFIHPYTALLTAVALGIYTVWVRGWQRYILWFFLIPVPVAIIMIWSWLQPGAAAWQLGGQSYTPVDRTFVWWLPWLVPAVLQLRARQAADRPWLVWLLLASGAAVLYPRVGRRFLDGVGIPLSILAFRWMAENWARRWRWHPSSIVFGPAAIIGIALVAVPASAPAEYLAISHVQMYAFLAAQPGSGSVWGPTLDSNMIPAFSGWHVVNGQPDESPGFRPSVLRFREVCAGNWHGTLGLASWLVERHVRYVVWPQYCNAFPVPARVVFRQVDTELLQLRSQASAP